MSIIPTFNSFGKLDPSYFTSALRGLTEIQQRIQQSMPVPFMLKEQQLYGQQFVDMTKVSAAINKAVSSPYPLGYWRDKIVPVDTLSGHNLYRLTNVLAHPTSEVVDLSLLKYFGSDTFKLKQTEYEFLISDADDESIDLTSTSTALVDESGSIKKILLDIFRDHSKLTQLHHRKFEEVIAELLSRQGFKVELTKQTRDGGYDILAILPITSHAPQKWLVECKRFKERRKVGIEIVRSFKEVVQAENANRGLIVTTSYFTADAIKKKKETPYLLDFRDRGDIIEWVNDYANKFLA